MFKIFSLAKGIKFFSIFRASQRKGYKFSSPDKDLMKISEDFNNAIAKLKRR